MSCHTVHKKQADFEMSTLFIRRRA